MCDEGYIGQHVEIKVNGQTVNNLRCADDAVFITDEEKKLRSILDRLQDEGIHDGDKYVENEGYHY